MTIPRKPVSDARQVLFPLWDPLAAWPAGRWWLCMKLCSLIVITQGSSFLQLLGPSTDEPIVDCPTDTNHRTLTDVRTAFTRTAAKLGAAGSVAHLFDHLAVLTIKGDDPDVVLEAMLNADINVDDVECEDGRVTLYAPASEFYKAKTALLEAFPGTELLTQEITFLPQAYKDISADDVPNFEKFINLLNDCDDVQEIYHNAILPG